MIGPQPERGADLAVITAFVVNARDAGTVPGTMIEDLLDDVRRYAKLGQPGCS